MAYIASLHTKSLTWSSQLSRDCTNILYRVDTYFPGYWAVSLASSSLSPPLLIPPPLRTEAKFFDKLVESVSVRCLPLTAPKHYSVEDYSGHCSMGLQTLKDLSLLRKYRQLWRFLISASVHLIVCVGTQVLVVLVHCCDDRVGTHPLSIINSFVLVTISCRWFSLQQSTNLLSTLLSSDSWALLQQPTMAENLCRGQNLSWIWSPKV